MEKIQKELKVLKSTRNDIERRIKKGEKDSLSQKVQKFIIDINIFENTIDAKTLDSNNYVFLVQEIESLKNSSNEFQNLVNNYQIYTSSRSQEEEILQNLQTLKEISKEILSELTSQNNISLKSFKNFESNEETIIKARSRLSKLEKFLDCLPTSCLVLSMSVTFLSTILVLSIL